MVIMEPDKVRYLGFCSLFLAFDRAKNTIVVYSELRIEPIETCWLRN